MRRYGTFPTTADVGIWARGTNASELFSAAGTGLLALETDLRRVRPRETRTVTASAEDSTRLVVDFLNRLLLLGQVEGFVGRAVHARTLGDPPTSVLATVTGEAYDPGRHRRKKEVKAVTWHQLELDLTRGRLRVIVDI
ncbi:MAG: archease [Thermoplasmata archaeon]